jgi:methyl-accepting chemotaxis protein
MIVVAKDFSSSRSAQSRSLVWQMLMALFAIVLMAGFILIVIRGVLLRPLQIITANFTRLDNDGDTPEESTPEMLCEELQELAQQYERLRDAKETV